MQRCFDKTVSRGPDMTALDSTPSGYMGFHRLAVMGLNAEGMQPFWMGKNMLVCNGEIYGFRALRRDLEAKGTSFIRRATARYCCPCMRNTA